MGCKLLLMTLEGVPQWPNNDCLDVTMTLTDVFSNPLIYWKVTFWLSFTAFRWQCFHAGSCWHVGFLSSAGLGVSFCNVCKDLVNISIIESFFCDGWESKLLTHTPTKNDCMKIYLCWSVQKWCLSLSMFIQLKSYFVEWPGDAGCIKRCTFCTDCDNSSLSGEQFIFCHHDAVNQHHFCFIFYNLYVIYLIFYHMFYVPSTPSIAHCCDERWAVIHIFHFILFHSHFHHTVPCPCDYLWHSMFWSHHLHLPNTKNDNKHSEKK